MWKEGVFMNAVKLFALFGIFVLLGYAKVQDRNEGCLNVTTHSMTASKTNQMAEEGSHNCMGIQVAEAIKRVALIWFGTDQQVELEFEREHSSGLTIRLPDWLHANTKLDPKIRQEKIDQAIVFFKSILPNKLSMDEKWTEGANTMNGFRLRVWWN
jgi:hypothetical protein